MAKAASPPMMDARALARVTLGDLATRLDRALQSQRATLDPYTRAHLTDSHERIAQALNIDTPAGGRE